MTTHGELVARYLAAPGPETLGPLRDAVRAVPGFDPDLSAPEVAGPAMARGAYDDAVAALLALMPGALFSPCAHAALAEALTRAGRPGAARREASLARAALRSILSTGDGSPARPWSVLRVSDEYDVLRALGRRPREQSLVQHGSRRLDRFLCTDGSAVHFEVTALLPSPAPRP